MFRKVPRRDRHLSLGPGVCPQREHKRTKEHAMYSYQCRTLSHIATYLKDNEDPFSLFHVAINSRLFTQGLVRDLTPSDAGLAPYHLHFLFCGSSLVLESRIGSVQQRGITAVYSTPTNQSTSSATNLRRSFNLPVIHQWILSNRATNPSSFLPSNHQINPSIDLGRHTSPAIVPMATFACSDSISPPWWR